MKALLRVGKGIELGLLENSLRAGHGEVAVRVIAASMNPTDYDMMSGTYDLWLKLSGANSSVATGLEFAGIVEEDSRNYKKGDRIFGYTHLMKGPKTHQERIVIKERYTAKTPDNVTFEQAASIAISGETSIVAIDDLAGLSRGQSVLIYGASGGVGTFAVQYANYRGLIVTAVAGPGQQAFLRSLGAKHVIDYTQCSIHDLSGPFDAVLDFSTTLRLRDIRHLLKTNGSFVPADPVKNLADIAGNVFRRRKTRSLYVAHGSSDRLAEIAQLVSKGHLRVEIDSHFPLEDYAKAFERLRVKGRRGRIVLNLAETA